MKQKFNTGRKNKKTVKKVLVGVGAGLLVLAAASGVAYGLNSHYKWVELPAWLTLPSEEVVEADHAVLIMSTDQSINSFGNSGLDDFGGSYSLGSMFIEPSEFVITPDLISIKFDATNPRYVGGVVFYTTGGTTLSLVYDDFENGFIYDFSELTVVAGEALVPVITAIA